MSPLVVINVYGWWESQHYTAAVIAVCDTEEDAIAAMLADASDLGFDIDPSEEWERDAIGITATVGGREAYRIERPLNKRVT